MWVAAAVIRAISVARTSHAGGSTTCRWGIRWAKSVSVVLISIAVRLRCRRWWSAPRFALSNGVHPPQLQRSPSCILVTCLVAYGSTHSSFSAVATSATVTTVAAAAYRWVASVLPWGGISSLPVVGVAFAFRSPASGRALHRLPCLSADERVRFCRR